MKNKDTIPRGKLIRAERWAKYQEPLAAYTFLLPSLIGVLIFSLGPLLFSLGISLTDWNYTTGLGNWNFIGLSNFKQLWTDSWFLSSLKNTLVVVVVTVPISLVISICLAALIENYCRKKIASFLRISMYMPHICNIVASCAVWMALFSSYGPFTLLVEALGWEDHPAWLASYEWALPALMLVMVWASLGYRVFIYSASMTAIPNELYEAATIDGANGLQRFWYVTVPQLKPTTFFLTITGIISSFKVFGYTNVMTKGGPGDSTYTLVYYLYRSAFQYYNFGYASAIAVVLFVILLIITLIQWRNNGDNER